MEKKTVLLDLSEINNFTSGFGQLQINYAKRFPLVAGEDVKFHYLLPPGYEQQFPDNVETSHFRRKYHKHFRKGLPSVDLWHSTNQQQLKRKLGKCSKFVLTIHDLNYLTEKGLLSRMKHNFVLQRAINKASAITAISMYVAQQVEQNFNMHGKPVRVIYNGVENITQQPEQQPQFVTGRPFFFAIGQIREKKNFHLLVDMMQHFPDYDLYVCGDDHFSFSQVVREHISQLPTHNAYLCGKISAEEKVWLYRHCEAFLFASMGEGFGLPAIEAMQFGKPVFISSYTCLPEICGDCAYVWEDLNIDHMAELVKNQLPVFVANAENAEKVKQHAEMYSYDRHIGAYMDLYRELLSNVETK